MGVRINMEPKLYTPWDLHGIDQAAVIFAYMENNHSGGPNLATEIGYGLGRRKLVIFVNEKDSRRWQLVEAASSVTFHNLTKGIIYL
ncbi:hypothetical protein LCGC14_2876900, partial [marine sediment metagenome]